MRPEGLCKKKRIKWLIVQFLLLWMLIIQSGMMWVDFYENFDVYSIIIKQNQYCPRDLSSVGRNIVLYICRG
jgi:hypothetical protein